MQPERVKCTVEEYFSLLRNVNFSIPGRAEQGLHDEMVCYFKNNLN